MAGTVKFTVDIETGKAVRGFLDLREAEKKTTDELKTLVGVSEQAGKAMAAAARAGMREFASAEKEMERAFSTGGRQSSAFNRIGPGAGNFYAMNRLLQKGQGSLNATRASDDAAFQSFLADERLKDAEGKFARWGKAQEIRASRNDYQDILYKGTIGPAAGNLYGMDRLLNRGQASLDAGKEKDAAEAEYQAQIDRHVMDKQWENSPNNLEAVRSKRAASLQGIKQDVKHAAVALSAYATMYFEGVRERMDAMNEAAERSEKEFRPLLSMGNNYKNAGNIREQVFGISAGFGIGSADVIEAIRASQATGSDLTKAQQGELVKSSIKLADATGERVPDSLAAAAKLMSIYRDSAGSAAHVINLLALANERAGFSSEEMSSLLVRSGTAAKEGGTSIEQMTAIVTEASHVFGRSREEVGIFNDALGKLHEAAKQGIISQGNLVDELAQVANASGTTRDQLEKVVGGEQLAKLSAVASHYKDILSTLDDINKLPANLLDNKIAKAWGDAPSAHARVVESLKAAGENQDAMWEASSQGVDNLKWKLRSRGAKVEGGPSSPEFFVGMNAWGAQNAPGWLVHDTLGTGMRDALGAARKSGNTAEEYYLKVAGGKFFNNAYTDSRGHQKFTNVGDADQFSKLRSEGFDLLPKDYAKYLELHNRNGSGQMAGALFLASHDQKEWDDLNSKGFEMQNPSDFVKYKNGFGNDGDAARFLESKAHTPEAKAYAIAREMDAAAGGTGEAAKLFDVATAKFAAAVDKFLGIKLLEPSANTPTPAGAPAHVGQVINYGPRPAVRNPHAHQ